MPRFTHRIPLLKDHHNHPFLYAALAEGVHLGALADSTLHPQQLRESAIRRIEEHAQPGRPGWNIVYGWNNGQYSLSPEDFATLPPVVVFHLSFHSMIVNRSGREWLKRDDPEVEANLENPEWIEHHLRRVFNVFAGAGASVERLQRFFHHLLTVHGVYHVEEMLLVNESELRIFEEAGLRSRTKFWAAPEVYDRLPVSLQAWVHGIKLFTDGAIGAWTAAMHRPYRDRGGLGILLYETPQLESLLHRYLGRGKPMAIHAIGDRAIDQVVTAVGKVGRPAGVELRIEHVQLISETTARRAKELGLTLSMQPNFSEDSVNYLDRLPDGYAERNNPFRMLIDRVGYVPGVDLIFGSDGMPHGWRNGLQQSLFPQGNHADQRLTLEEFIAGYCLPNWEMGHIEFELDDGLHTVTGQVVGTPAGVTMR